MPFVNVQTIKGIMSSEQKNELLRRMTDLIVEIEGKGDPEFRRSVWIRIDEHEPEPEQWSLGGMQPTSQMIAAKFAPPQQS
ncbi:tautomerase family protein [Raoultella ornithinolytica]|uniref:tautomerase family protein n=1 Tax=Raoultella ornithinolytica TaxID=54291 RepID=UPI001951CF22|nr:tautomerase family protein [Raoultella ornithinolytica]MBM6480217.1 tautomerase family protein [Raoultella ornithinolytica]